MKFHPKGTDAIRYFAEIDNYLRRAHNEQVRNQVFKEFDRLLGLDVSGKITSYVRTKVLDAAFQNTLPGKIWKASINCFRTAWFNLQARSGQAQENTNMYSPRGYPAEYADFTIWTWQHKGAPWYVERQYV